MNHSKKEIQRKIHPICQDLIAEMDEAYAKFDYKLNPQTDPSRILGIRVPILRKFTKDLIKESKVDLALKNQIDEFLQCSSHAYLEEDLIHALLINEIKDWESMKTQLLLFFSRIDSWKACDILSPKFLKRKMKDHAFKIQFQKEMKDWLQAENIYQARFAMIVFMNHFLKENYSKEIVDWIAYPKRPDFYFWMAQSWFLATAMIDHFEDVYEVLNDSCISENVYKKSISKGLESFRVSDENKEKLRNLRALKRT